ncbi:hypothetical protein AMTR_s00069p00176100 [Amborella trichopoda]|uniref:Uncharacterized protein n=2 Tax=Amborella trichopoda TaxID=13333 RepID=U5DG74_AMBTC|nr:hypothetical protein AMTR_s00069p00176100 [Amborella trichopoda]
MGDLNNDVSAKSMHHLMLQDVLGSSDAAKESFIYSYGRSFNGFAARLTDEEVQTFSEMEGVVSVIPNTMLQLHTTRSWDFMGLTMNVTTPAPYETDVVVGLLDTGIWPESLSFNDEGMGPPPKSWKGICQTADNFTCNNKIIGARFYKSDGYYDETDFKSPRDSVGHGTHTASTAAGRPYNGASYFGLGKGLARGGVPSARVAVYKVCWAGGRCGLADILAGFDDAIADGCHILSVSLGASSPVEYMQDPIAIGSFHAMKNGILTSNSAGNSGPSPYSVSNNAPWSLTVAASTIDRKFVSQVQLGNGQIYAGHAINSFALNGTYPLIYGGDAANYSAGATDLTSKYCIQDTLNSFKTEGKIVLCDFLYDGSGVLQAKGLGTIMSDRRYTDFAFSYPLPATLLLPDEGESVKAYIRSTSTPIGTILKGETFQDSVAPTVVSFSSRGPNAVTLDILKPDLTAPGVDILAAWSPVAPPSGSPVDKRSVDFNIISGTSMSCPHVSGAAAYVKSYYPSWSPAAIKSALMTTASFMDSRKNEEAEFAYGSGHIDPVRAVHPGLVYDAGVNDYIDFLCKQGYNTTTLRLITGDNTSSCASSTYDKAWGLNYPSIALSIADGQPIKGVFPRTVTNVGYANSTYHAFITAPSGIKITVEPNVLSFKSVGEKQSFLVKIDGGVVSQLPIQSGAITWNDGVHQVRSPVIVYTVLPSMMMPNTVMKPFSFDESSFINGLL